MRKVNYNDVKQFYKDNGYEIFINEEDYFNSQTKFSALNSEGYLIYTSYREFKGENGKARYWHKCNPYSIYNINHYCKINNLNIHTIDEEYVNLNKQKMKWVCSNCGDIFECRLGHIISGNKITCNKCSKERELNKRTYKINDVINVFLNNGLKLLEDYKNTKTYIKCETKEGYYVISNYNNCKNNSKPLIFHKLNPYTIYNIKHYININNIDVELLSNEYIDSKEKLKWKCKCGREYLCEWDRFYVQKAYRCERCSKSMSNLEKYVEDWLIKNNVNSIKQFKFDDCKYKRSVPFDFAIFKNNKLTNLIEVDGIQHFQPIEYFGGQDRFEERIIIDKIKDDYCKENNINLIRIPYWEFDENNTYINKLKILL